MTTSSVKRFNFLKEVQTLSTADLTVRSSERVLQSLRDAL